eukprot:6984783-Alexandrium_andersonii.AAC.1
MEAGPARRRLRRASRSSAVRMVERLHHSRNRRTGCCSGSSRVTWVERVGTSDVERQTYVIREGHLTLKQCHPTQL